MRGSKAIIRAKGLVLRQILAIKKAILEMVYSVRPRIASERGQGTTEYAILVGVLVVVAILAITIFKPKLEELWNAIATGIQGL